MRPIAVLAVLGALVTTGCAGSLWSSARRPDIVYRVLAKGTMPVMPPPGVLYGDVHAPLFPAASRVGTKKGTATAHEIGLPPLPYAGLVTGLDLFAWGDASVDQAQRAGGIGKVGYVDFRMQTYLFVYRRFTIEAYGD